MPIDKEDLCKMSDEEIMQELEIVNQSIVSRLRKHPVYTYRLFGEEFVSNKDPVKILRKIRKDCKCSCTKSIDL